MRARGTVRLVLPASSRRLLRHTLLRPTTSPTTSGPPGSRLGCDRSPVILLLDKQRPDDPGHLVGERDRYQQARFASQHLFEPRTPRRTAFACLLYDGATANDEQASERTFAHFGCCTELLLAACRSLKRRETQPGGKVAALGEGLDRRCQERSSACAIPRPRERAARSPCRDLRSCH